MVRQAENRRNALETVIRFVADPGVLNTKNVIFSRIGVTAIALIFRELHDYSLYPNPDGNYLYKLVNFIANIIKQIVLSSRLFYRKGNLSAKSLDGPIF
jgi:hypothetical protein